MTDYRLIVSSDLFDPTRLRVARHAAMLHKKDLAELVGVSAGAISQFENGTSTPTPKTVASLALALGVPSGYFAADRPLGEAPTATAHFRSLRSTTKRERDRAFAHSLMAWELSTVIERYVRLPQNGLTVDLSLRPDDPVAHAEEAARRARVEFELGQGPIANVVRLLESRGVVCTRLPAKTRRVFAFSCDFPTRPVVVLSTERTHRAAGRFDAAHELGHLLMHHDTEPGMQSVERQANVFASEFLAPASEVAEELPARIDWKHLLSLKQRWGISIQALLFRARSLRVMPEHTYRRAVTELNARGWRTEEPGDSGNAEEPVMLRRAIDMMADKGRELDRLADESRLSVEAIELIAPPDDRPTLDLVH